YRDGHVMPGGDGSGERSPTPPVAVPRTAATDLSAAPRTYFFVKFNSYRRRGMVGSPPATSNLYDVLKKVDWLAIFSPWAIINRSKIYAMTTNQYTSATSTPANKAALKDFLRRAPLRSGLAIVRGSTTVLPKIFMVRRAHHDIKPNTCATRTPANNAALKALAIAKPAPMCRRGGITVVPKIFMVRRAHHDIKPYTGATRTDANKAALKPLAIAQPAPISGRGGITVVPKILMVRRAHHDIKPNTCATRTPANNAALKGLAIAKG